MLSVAGMTVTEQQDTEENHQITQKTMSHQLLVNRATSNTSEQRKFKNRTEKGTSVKRMKKWEGWKKMTANQLAELTRVFI